MSEERMDPAKLRPFVLEEALAGEPVYTADGDTVIGFHFFIEATGFCLGGVIGAHANVWTRQGNFNLLGNCGRDLRLGPKTRTVWINLWESVERKRISPVPHETREKALQEDAGGCSWRLLDTFAHTFEVKDGPA